MNGIASRLEEHVDELETGETVRVNHSSCPAGEDTRRRLYITKRPDVILGYCHNCGDSASRYIGTRDRYRKSDSSFIKQCKPSEYVAPLLVAFHDKDNIPVEAEAWRIKSKLTRDQCAKYEIQYAPETDSIYLPFYTLDGFTNGHQLRPLHRTGAKYVNCVKDSDEELGGIVSEPTLGTDTIVIVEDLISGIHCNLAGVDALVNYGTHVKPSVLYYMAQDGYKHMVVWLDNDSSVVNKKASDMYNILHMYKTPEQTVRRISGEHDPKHLTTDQIQRKLRNGFA
jgi:hypothetical protein